MKTYKYFMLLGIMAIFSINKGIAITDTSLQCTANFNYKINWAIDYLGEGIPIEFTNTSTGNNLQYWWDFGDGSSSTLANPIHIFAIKPHIMLYPEPPISKVCLTIFKNGCKDIICKEIYSYRDTINQNDCNAWFTYNEIPDPAPEKKYLMGVRSKTMQFNGFSDNDVVNWHWNFTYGEDSYEQNTVGTIYNQWLEEYKAYGTVVSLTIITRDSCTFTYKSFVEFEPDSGQCQVNYTYFLNDSLNRDDSIMYFFNGYSDQEVKSWYWDFGDGLTSDLQNPVHFFPNYRMLNTWDSKCGPFKKCIVYNYVCLKITTESGCTNSICQEIFPGTNPPNTDCSAKFEYIMSKSLPPIYTFSNISQWNKGNVYWDFGDGTSSTEENPSQVFNYYYPFYDSLYWKESKDSMVIPADLISRPVRQDFNVCLTIYDSTGCTSSYCETIYAYPDSTTEICDNYIKLTTSSILGTATCNGSATAELVDKTGSPKNASSYEWSTNEVGQTIGFVCPNTIYWVSVTDDRGCVATGSFSIYDYTNPWTYPGEWGYTGIDSFYIFTFNPKYSNCQIEWTFNDGVVLNGNYVPHSFTSVADNWVNIKVTDNVGNIIYQERKYIDTQTSDIAITKNREFCIYPVPADNNIYIELRSAIAESVIEIADLTGRIVASTPSQAGQLKLSLNIENINKGVYICRIRSGKNILFTTKFIKQ